MNSNKHNLSFPKIAYYKHCPMSSYRTNKKLKNLNLPILNTKDHRCLMKIYEDPLKDEVLVY